MTFNTLRANTLRDIDILEMKIEILESSYSSAQTLAHNYHYEIRGVKKSLKENKHKLRELDWPAVGDTYYCAHFIDPKRPYKVKNTYQIPYGKRMVEMGLAFKTPTEAVKAATQLRLRVENFKRTDDLS